MKIILILKTKKYTEIFSQIWNQVLRIPMRI